MSKTEDVSLVRYAQAVMILTQIKDKYGVGSKEADDAEDKFKEAKRSGQFKHDWGLHDTSP